MPKQCDRRCPLRSEHQLREPDDHIELQSHEFLDQSHVAEQLYLPIQEWQTRVLILKNGSLNSPLVADLLIVDLIFDTGVVIRDTLQRTEYLALSHTWGQPNFSQRLTVNGLQFSITENLFQYLQRYRQRNQPQALWIDAICINQHDDAEKSSQVANMLNIYRKARSTEVWLGEAGQYSKLSMEYLCWETGLADPFKHRPECRRKVLSVIEGMTDLYRRPWLQRIWIRQEVWAANSLQVVCGSHVMPWDAFAKIPDDILERLTRCVPKELILSRQYIEAQGLNNLTKGLSRHRRTDFLGPREDTPVTPEVGQYRRDIVRVLNESIDCHATDERDRVYGILGMTKVKATTQTERTGFPEPHLVIDYSKSLAHVFCDVARYVMERESSLAAALGLKGQFGSADLPSWCPDWRLKTSWLPSLSYEHCIRGFRSTYAADSDHSDSRGSDDSRADHEQALFWDSAASGGSTVLLLKGVKLATLTADSDFPVVRKMRLRARERDRTDRTFGQLATLERRALARHLIDASQETKAEYEQQILSTGSCEIEVNVRVRRTRGREPLQRKTQLTLRLRDLEFKQVKLIVVPPCLVPDDGESESDDEGDEDDKSARSDIKTMHATASEGVEVPETQTLDSFLLFNFKQDDDKAERRARSDARRRAKDYSPERNERRPPRAWEERDAPQTRDSTPSVGIDSQFDESDRSFKSLDSWRTEDNEQDYSDDANERNNRNYTDTDSHGTMGDASIYNGDNGEGQGFEASVITSSDNSVASSASSSSSSPSSSSPFNVSNASTEDLTPDESWTKLHAHRHFSVSTLNKLYNEHFPTEFAVPQKAKSGDIVVMLQGSAVPFVLRPLNSEGQYTYAGPAFLSYRSVYIASTVPEPPVTSDKHFLDWFTRPQESIYQHFLLLLGMRVEEGTAERFEIV